MNSTYVVVGSTSEVKIDAVRRAGRRMRAYDWVVTGVKADSGVSDQPRSDHEMLVGATNRALVAVSRDLVSYAFGIESGIHHLDGRWFDSAWVVCVTSAAFGAPLGVASTLRMPVPDKIVELVFAGDEVATACEKVYGVPNGKVHGAGLFEQHSDTLLSRTEAIRDAVIAAYKDLIKKS